MGRWVERDTSFLNFDVYNCQYCGKVIPRRIYYEAAGGKEHPFCGPQCHQRLEVRIEKEAARQPGTDQGA